MPPARTPANRVEPLQQDLDAFVQALRSHLTDVCALSREQVGLLFSHYVLFQRWNKVLNLSTVVDFESVVLRHYCESLFLAARLPGQPSKIVDVGSGAGFPGIPVAVLHPESKVCLVEARQRKAVFLSEATRALPNVEVRNQRGEDLGGNFDWLVSRAVAWKDLKPVALKTTAQIALLTSVSESGPIIRDKSIEWREALPLPWGKQIVLLTGKVSRGT